MFYNALMAVDEIKKEIEKLSPEERREISIFLTKIRLENDEKFWEKVRERTDDKSDSNWVTADEL